MSNLPPGVTDSMIPGNRPEDQEAERIMHEFEELVWPIVVKYTSDHDTELLFSAEEFWTAVLTFADNQYMRGANAAASDAKLDREMNTSQQRLYTDLKQLLALFDPADVVTALMRVHKGEGGPDENEADAY